MFLAVPPVREVKKSEEGVLPAKRSLHFKRKSQFPI
jgi:hypothetical protein